MMKKTSYMGNAKVEAAVYDWFIKEYIGWFDDEPDFDPVLRMLFDKEIEEGEKLPDQSFKGWFLFDNYKMTMDGDRMVLQFFERKEGNVKEVNPFLLMTVRDEILYRYRYLHLIEEGYHGYTSGAGVIFGENEEEDAILDLIGKEFGDTPFSIRYMIKIDDIDVDEKNNKLILSFKVDLIERDDNKDLNI